jgi:formamidopyrimidine-DNA glycosylase
MPELPDLQVASKNLHEQFSGKVLEQFNVQVAKRLTDSEAALKTALEGKQLLSVSREGKELRFHFDRETVLGMHLMLHGELKTFDGNMLPRFPVVTFHFSDGTGLALTDFQKQARVRLNPEQSMVPDALSKEVNAAFLKNAFSARPKSKVKALLMDQDVIRGIGNAYADEILYQACISPFSLAGAIPEVRLKVLARCIKSVLKGAESQIRKKEPGLISGEIRDFLLIHNAKRGKSPAGKKILMKKSGGKKTYYTSEQNEFF